MFQNHRVWIVTGLWLIVNLGCGGSRGGGSGGGGLLPPTNGNDGVNSADSSETTTDTALDSDESSSDAPFVSPADAQDTTESCSNECTDGSTTCAGNAIRQCGNYDSDPCTEWGPEVACPSDQFCAEGKCGDKCVDDCVANTKECQKNAARICGEYDNDPCWDWSPTTDCGEGNVCTEGTCHCEDQCTANGSSECVGEAIRTCADFDEDTCLEWSVAEPCPEETTCEKGVCVPVMVCDDPDKDGYGSGCNLGPDCNEGNPDQNEIQCEGKVCGDNGCGGICGECVKEGEISLICSEGQCVLPKVIINEFVYDAVGSDAKAVFIELKGAPNTVLDGLKIAGINGNGGKPYTSFTLSGTIPATGYFVIAHTSTELNVPIDQFSGSADLQNGPDSVHLIAGDVILDSVAYGVFDGDNIANGEGNPAPSVTIDSGLALGRIPDAQDTGDNEADFQIVSPTPGSANKP